MSSIKCKFCGAVNNANDERCFSCSAPLPKRSNLSEKDKESLTNYIKSVDDMLKAAQDKADKVITPAFILLAIAGIASTVGLYNFLAQNSTTLFVILAIVWAFVLFIVFGSFVTKYQNKAMLLEFNTKIKYEINEYLDQMHFTEADFKTVASEILNEKSNLIKFISYL